jgi:hypothetical protein
LSLRAILYALRAEGRAGARASIFQIFLRSETEGKYLRAHIWILPFFSK